MQSKDRNLCVGNAYGGWLRCGWLRLIAADCGSWGIEVGDGGGVYSRHAWPWSYVDPRIPTMQGRGTSGFHRASRHCSLIAPSAKHREALGSFAERVDDILRTACEADFVSYGWQASNRDRLLVPQRRLSMWLGTTKIFPTSSRRSILASRSRAFRADTFLICVIKLMLRCGSRTTALHDLGHAFWVGCVLYRSFTASHYGIGCRWSIDDLSDRDDLFDLSDLSVRHLKWLISLIAQTKPPFPEFSFVPRIFWGGRV